MTLPAQVWRDAMEAASRHAYLDSDQDVIDGSLDALVDAVTVAYRAGLAASHPSCPACSTPRVWHAWVGADPADDGWACVNGHRWVDPSVTTR